MSIFGALNTALYSRLQGDSDITGLLAGTTAIYYQQAPDNPSFDYIVYSLQGGGDENLTGNRTKNMVYSIRAYSRTGPAKAGSIDAQIDASLHMIPLTAAGWANFWIAREDDISAVEYGSNNEKTYMAGGFYRIRLDKN